MQNTADFVAARVFPNVPVEKQSDVYYEYDRGDFNRNQAKKRAAGDESSGGGFRVSTSPYFADVWAHHKDLPAQTLANEDAALDLRRAASEYVAHQLLIAREKDWADTFFTGGVWTGDVDGVASSPASGEVIQWSDTTNGDPIGDIRSAKTSVKLAGGFKPNTLVMGEQVYDALVDHPDIVDRVKYAGGLSGTDPAMVNEQTLAQLFGISRVMVMGSVENTAAEGQTESHSFIGGKKALLCYAAPSPGLMTPTAGYTFSWRGYLGTSNEFGIATQRFPIDAKKVERVEGEMSFDQKLVSADLGYFWDAIVA